MVTFLTCSCLLPAQSSTLLSCQSDLPLHTTYCSLGWSHPTKRSRVLIRSCSHLLMHKKTMVLLFPNMNILTKKLQLTMLCNDQHTRKPLAVNNAAHLQNFICIGVSRSIHDVREIIWFRKPVTNQKHSQDKGDNLA